jgi:hypothetical protein
MPKGQAQWLEKIRNFEMEASNLWSNYWQQYSHMGTWQFWVNVGLLIGSLIVLYVFIDRRKAFQIGFYGFNVHVWFTYIDLFGSRNGLWEYPYKVFPIGPINVALDTSFVPVTFMLMYQWSLNRNKNYYVTLISVGIVFAAIIKPIMSALSLFYLFRWMNYFYLFLAYLIIILISKWITNLFAKFQESAGTLH